MRLFEQEFINIENVTSFSENFSTLGTKIIILCFLN